MPSSKISPAVLAGALVVGAGAAWLRKKPKKTNSNKADDTTPVPTVMVYVPPMPGTGTGTGTVPGNPCEVSGNKGAYDENGNCKVFWVDGETDEAVVALAREEWKKRGSPSFSKLCLMVEDPLGGKLAPPVDNPILTAIVATALQQHFGVGAVFPPSEAQTSADYASPYWVQRVWAKGTAAITKDLCVP